MSGPTYFTDQDVQNLKSKSQYTIFIELIFFGNLQEKLLSPVIVLSRMLEKLFIEKLLVWEMGTESCGTSNRQKETFLCATLFVTTVKSEKSCGHHEHLNNLFWVKLVRLLQFCVFPFSIFRPPTHPIRETLLKPTTTVLLSVVIVN